MPGGSLKLWVGGLILCLGIGLAGASAAEDQALDSLFTIRALEVDIVARSAAAARLQAIEEVEARGYDILVAKLTRAEDRGRLPELTRQERLSLIAGLEVVEEQSSNRRYRAVYNVRFEPELVSDHFAAYSVPHVFGAGGTVVVLHSHERGGIRYLWAADPLIAEARASVDWRNRIRRYVWLDGRLDDRLNLTADQVFEQDLQAADALLSRYPGGAETVIPLIIATTYDQAQGQLKYNARLGASALVFEGMVADNTEAAAIGAALTRVADQIDNDWRSKLLVDVSASGTLSFEVETPSLEHWLTLKAGLERVSLVRDYRLKALGLPISRLEIDYSGRTDQLVLALEALGLEVELQGEDGNRIRVAAG